MKVGWLADQPGYVGGAELTQAEFRAVAPAGVEIVDCPPGHVKPGLDAYAIHNCLQYSVKDLKRIGRKPATRYWNDVGNWYPRELRGWLDANTVAICCSRLQAEHMGFVYKPQLIPPPVNLDPFERAAVSVNGNRQGIVSVAQWRAVNKGARAVELWANEHGEHIDFYGSGPCAPKGTKEVAYQGMPALLAAYQRFVFLPRVCEPFGRSVAEAWAAGCEITVNRLVGALEWIEGNPDALHTAAQDYWQLVAS